MEHVDCIQCEKDHTVPWAKKDGIQIVQCRDCGLIYSNPRLDSQELQEYYDATYFADRSEAADPARYQMYQLDVAEITSVVGTEGKFLDVGCANGIFLSVLPKSFQKYGIDFSRSAVKLGREHYGFDLRAGQLSESDFEPGFFDIVHLRAVIEHMQNPARDLAAAHRLLKPGGWLIVSTTPNIDGPIGRIYRERFRLVFPKEHIYYFSPKTLGQLLHKTGFVPKRWTYPYRGTPYANPLNDLKSAVVNYVTGKESPPFWKNVMTCYARKEFVQ